MAHKLAHRQQSTGDDPPDIDRDTPDNDPEAPDIEQNESAPPHITRRGYVRLGGTTIATVAAIVGWGNGVAASTGDTGDRDHLIRIHGSGTPSIYEVTVGGQLVPEGGSSRAAGHVSGSTAEGTVVGGDCGYRFRGELSDVTVDGDAEVTLDGEVIGL